MQTPFDVTASAGSIPMEQPPSSGRLGSTEAPTWGDLIAEREAARGGAGAIFQPGEPTVPVPAEPEKPTAPDHSAELATLRGQVAGLGQALGRQPQVDPNAIAGAVAAALANQANVERGRQVHMAAMAPPQISEELAQAALTDPNKLLELVDRVSTKRIEQAATQIQPTLAAAAAAAQQVQRVGPQVVQGQMGQVAQMAAERALQFGIGNGEFAKLYPEAVRRIQAAPNITPEDKTNMLLDPATVFNAITLVRNDVGPMQAGEEPPPTLAPSRRQTRGQAPAGNQVHNAMLDRTEKILGIKFTKEERAAARQHIAKGVPPFERAMR